MAAALRLVRDSFSPSRESLLSPALDTLMMGGASIVFYLLWIYCFPYASHTEDARQLVPVAAALLFSAYCGLPSLHGYFVPLEQYSGWLFLSLFHVFLNIHHYIIDNVIWKKDNRPVVHYLFSTRPLEAVSPPRAPSLQPARI